VSTFEKPGFLAIELDGAGWDGADLARAVLAAESAGFHAATFTDAPAPGRANALLRAAFAGPVTHTIALVPEVDTGYTEPFHVSTQLASLDYVSGGRAGWLVGASDQAADAAAVGRSVVASDGLGREAADSIEVSRRLWDSWEDYALIRDVATVRYIDVDNLHYVDFESTVGFENGSGYSVKGPSIIPRPLQGQLPVLAPAGLLDGNQLSAGAADAVLVSAPTPGLLAGEIAEARAAAPGAAIIAELDVVLDARGQSAAGRLAELDAHTPWQSSRARFVGTAAELTGLLASILETADGVRLHPAVLDVDLEELAQLVLPALRSRGLLAPQQPGSTFRDLLGLQRPSSRYAGTQN